MIFVSLKPSTVETKKSMGQTKENRWSKRTTRRCACSAEEKIQWTINICTYSQRGKKLKNKIKQQAPERPFTGDYKGNS
jgi:hypothetical protein